MIAGRRRKMMKEFVGVISEIKYKVMSSLNSLIHYF